MQYKVVYENIFLLQVILTFLQYFPNSATIENI